MSLEDIKKKIEIVRNDTNTYGFDNDNRNLALILDFFSEMLEEGLDVEFEPLLKVIKENKDTINEVLIGEGFLDKDLSNLSEEGQQELVKKIATNPKIVKILEILNSDNEALDTLSEIGDAIENKVEKDFSNLGEDEIAALNRLIAHPASLDPNASNLSLLGIAKLNLALKISELLKQNFSNLPDSVSEDTKAAFKSLFGISDVPEIPEDALKNIGNSDLQIPAGVVRILDLTGVKFQFKGLENKRLDASFTRKLIVNERGEVAYSDSADTNISVTMPETSTITLNHIYPSQIPELPEAFNKMKEFMRSIGNGQFVPIGRDKLLLQKVDEEDRVRISEGGNIYVESASKIDNDNKVYWGVTADVVLPHDKNWCFVFTGTSLAYELRAGVQKFGFSRGLPENSTTLNAPETAVLNILRSTITGEGLPNVISWGIGKTFTIIYTKVGDIINISVFTSDNKKASINIDAMSFMGNYHFVINGGASKSYVYNQTQYSGLKYYIEP